MQKVILYIQPQLTNTNTAQDFVRVDLMEEELISLTQVIQDVSDIDKLFTDYSRTFNLPASKSNNKIFKHWYNPDIQGFDANIFCEARIELNHLHFRFGKIQLNEVVLKHNEPSMYKVTFFGNTLILKNKINEDQLSDLVWLNNFNHDADADYVKDALQNGKNITVDSVSYANAIIYPLIAHSQSYIYDSSNVIKLTGTATSSANDKLVDENKNFTNVVLVGDVVKNTTDNTIATITAIDENTKLTLSSDIMSNGENYTIFEANGLNIYAAGENLTQRGVLPEDLKPAIPVKNIIKAIEQQYNITFKTSEFLDSAAMNNLYFWLHRAKGRITGDLVVNLDNSSFTCSTPTANCPHFNGISYPEVNFSFGTYTFTQPIAIGVQYHQGYSFQVNVSPSSSSIPYTIEIIDSLTDTIVASANNLLGAQSHSIGYGDSYPNALDINESKRLFARVRSVDPITFSATIQISHNYKDNGDASTGTGSGRFERDFIANYSSASSSIVTSATIIITEQIPEISIKDFLNGLFRAFNLTAYVDFNDQIVVRTLDNYYAGGDTFDITEFVKTDEHTVSEALPFSNIDLEYSEPKSILAQTFKSTNNKRYGELNYIGDASKKNEYKITLPFEQMLFERLQDKTSAALTTVQVGSFLDDNLQPSIGQPLLFYGIHQQNVSTSINFLYSTRPEAYAALCPTGTNHSLDDYWIPSVCNELGTSTTAPTYNLNFGSEINTFTLTDYGGNNNSLFQTYYTNYITRVFNKKTRIFKFSAILPLKVLLNLTLDDLIVVGTRAYTINKMSTKLQSGETNLELLNEPT